MFSAPLMAGGLTVTPVLALKQVHNDNLFYDYSDAGISGRSVEELLLRERYAGEIEENLTGLSYGLNLRDRTGNTDLTLNALGEMLRYGDHGALDATDQLYQGRFVCDPKARWRLNLSGGYQNDSQNDRIGHTGLGIERHTIRSAGIGSDYRLTRRLSANIACDYYSDTFKRHCATDIGSNQVSGGLTWQLDPRFYVLLNAGRADYDFADWYYEDGTLHRNLFGEVINASVYAGAGFQLDERFDLLVYAGQRKTANRINRENYPNLASFNERGTIGHVRLAYHDRFNRLDLTCRDDVSPAGADTSASRKQTMSLDASRRFSQALRAGIRFEYLRERSENATLKTFAEYEDEETRRLRPFLHLEIIDGLELEVLYSYSRTRDHEDHRTRKQRLSSLRLVWQYPFDF